MHYEYNNEKIELIKSKIISDTLYKKTIPKFKLHDSSLNFETEDSSGNLCGIKILFVLEYSKRKTIKLNLLDNPEYFSILNKINSNNIKIWILNSKQGQAIYGTMGSSGVIYLRTENKELKKFLKSKIKTHKLN